MAQLKDLIVLGTARILNKIYASEFVGKLTGNADTATSSTKATQDESGNNIKASYASSIDISEHTITLKNKNGTSLGTVTVPDNNTWRGIQNNLTSDSATDSLSAAQGKVLKSLVDGKAASSHTHSQYLTSHQDISQVMKNRGWIGNTTDFNTLVDSGCYKIQMPSWGDVNTYHGPNELKSNLYSFGLMLVIRADTSDTEKRITQIYFPHNSDDNNHPVVMRMHNGSDINSGWHAK